MLVDEGSVPSGLPLLGRHSGRGNLQFATNRYFE